MPNTPVLLAIMCADLEGYSLQMNRNEMATIAFVKRCFDRARRATLRFGGTLVKTTGDGWIALFPSATTAVDCARLLQNLIGRREPNRPSLFRIGIHLGEVHIEDGEIYGHAVNTAARLQTVAEAGGIVVSQPVAAMIAHSPRHRLEAIGHPLLKNIGDDLGVYRCVAGSASREAAESLQLDIVGGVRISTKIGRTLVLRSTHAMALLGILALDPDQTAEVDRTAVMLWPERPLKKARQALAQARRLVNAHASFMSDGLIRLNGQSLQLDTGAVEIDLHQIYRMLLSGAVDPMLRRPELIVDALMAGFDGISPLFATWLRVRRIIWRDRLVSALELCLERHDDAQPSLRAAAEALLTFEPGHEPASHALMRHFAATSRKDAALREFDRLSIHLRKVYHIEPGTGMSDMAAALRGSDSHPTAGPITTVRSLLPQIAISSFATQDAAARPIAETFRSDLLANLSRFRTWVVLDVDDDSVGVADYVLTGRCDVTATGANMNLRLVEPKSRRVAWSTMYSISAAEWRKVQGQVIGRIAAALEVYVSADRLAQGVTSTPTDKVDYDDWLRGDALLLRWTSAADEEAKAIFTKMTARTPDFAPAYASLASIHNVRHILQPGIPRSRADDDAARINAALAVELDPLDARNHLALAWSAALAGWFDQAGAHLDLAVSLNPFSPATLISAAMGYAFLGDHQRAGETLDTAISLSPMLRSHQWCYAAAVRFLGGDDTATIAAALRSGDQIADNQGWLAAALARQGNIAAARLAFDRLVATLTPIWAGSTPPDAQSVQAWFVTAYPIRREEDRTALSRALRLAMPGDALTASGNAGM
jgi:class 3 adenylate cyclase/DNA-binding SARP family transcriptional activator